MLKLKNLDDKDFRIQVIFILHNLDEIHVYKYTEENKNKVV